MIHFLISLAKSYQIFTLFPTPLNNYLPSLDLFKEKEMASSKFLISLRHLISGRCCIFFYFLLCFFFLFCERCRSEASAAPKTDPIEARAVNTILGRWRKTESSLWNISGELCSGVAIDDIDVDQFNLAIKCDCNFHNGTVCHITLLKVYEQNVTGAFPKELSNLTYLTNLNIARNYLTGPLPAFIGNMSSLQYLEFGTNALSGPIPRELGNLKNLIYLGLAPNNFNGNLPTELGGLKNLQQCYIINAGLSGELPASISNLTAMQILRIGELINGSSSLAFIRNMTNLNTLIVRNSKISDTLPSDFAYYTSLMILDLSFNKITGNIPESLFNLSSLNFLFLGNNSITGTLPRIKSSTLSNMNLVANNFVINNSNSSVLPLGLECLQRDMPCYRDLPTYYKFAINCGGGRNVTSYDGTNFDIDNADLSATSYFVTNAKNWAVSTAGSFIGALNIKANYIISSQIQSQNTFDSKLFMTARMSPSSLRYYGLGLENGNYTVKLHFSEIGIVDQPTWTSLARRLFDIYIQGMLKEKDFDIRKEAGGKSFTVVMKEYQALVTNNFLEIHFFWEGKGTTFIPNPGYYGPSISAISVSPYDFIPSVNNKPPHSSSSNNNKALVVGIVCGVVVLGLTMFAILVWKHKQKNLNKDNEELLEMTAISNTFSYSELRTATEDFNQSNFLGEGGFGSVFKGKLHDGRMVAVKQLSLASQQGERQFTAEIATISTVQHRNLAKLYGCCIEGDKRLLVYEYLENKSLDQAIFRKKDLHVDWKTRYEICLGVARGLAYLHEESSVRIIHRDVKSSNILLDGNLTPKISDFGLAKLYDDKWTHISTRVAGTIGYLAPEYAMRGHLTEKADVFGFGVVALEILSGRRNSDPSLEEEQSYLLDWAWHLYEQKHELELVDRSLSSYNRDEVTRVIGVSLLCIQASPTLRPAMSTVVAMLAGLIEVNEVTSRPSYLTECHFKDISSNFASDSFCKSTDLRETNSQVSMPSNADTVNL
ncbi:hypothetical protein M5K25_020297 [Dendrobium thyrsiflorum]|uniref:non-specific serine/threonine protein kinase n=1 Tax=Dendrobium thyrsiflorum TaxID=117978 RepID=A0ABD0UGC2_DENTH